MIEETSLCNDVAPTAALSPSPGDAQEKALPLAADAAEKVIPSAADITISLAALMTPSIECAHIGTHAVGRVSLDKQARVAHLEARAARFEARLLSWNTAKEPAKEPARSEPRSVEASRYREHQFSQTRNRSLKFNLEAALRGEPTCTPPCGRCLPCQIACAGLGAF